MSLQQTACLEVANSRVESIYAVLLVPLSEGQAGKRHKGVLHKWAEPRVAGNNLGAVATANDELACRVLQTAKEVNLVCTASERCLISLNNRLGRLHKLGRCREDYRLALLNLKLEVARSEKVLVTLVATAQLLLILEVVVPVGGCDKFGILLRELHMSQGKPL